MSLFHRRIPLVLLPCLWLSFFLSLTFPLAPVAAAPGIEPLTDVQAERL